ncbi:MAG: hypothetical protein JXR49_07530 [Acidobacteria bacterium]|nr:hypothetical protein [Acidobacteriota bacterium]
MKRIAFLLMGFMGISIGTFAEDLSESSSKELLAVYQQLRSLQGSGDVALTENVVFKRDAATFTLKSGHLTFAAPVEGRILAAQFEGEGTFELTPPTFIHKYQMARFTGEPDLVDTFSKAVFFFTDDTVVELKKILQVKPSRNEKDKTDIASKQKFYSKNYNDWINNRRKGHPTMRNLAARMLADLTDSTSKGFFLADFKGKESGDLLFHISWNRDSLLLPDSSKGEEVILLHLNPGDYYEWMSGFHLASEYAETSRPDHNRSLVHCSSMDIDLSVPNNRKISAVVDLEYVVKDAPVRVLPFNLNGVLRISSIEDSTGNTLSFIQEARDLDSDPWLILPGPSTPGETGKLKITYQEDSTSDSRIIYKEGGGLYYVTSRASWFPSFKFLDDRTMFRLKAHSPKNYKFLASGSLVSSEKKKKELVTIWKSEIPLGVFGFNYGDFVESSNSSQSLTVTAYSGKEIPNELKQLEMELSVAELAGYGREINQMGIMTGGFNTAQNVKYAAGISFQAFSLFEFLYGPLPFKTISVTEQPIRGYGQSWPNLIFLPYDSLLDATTRNSLGLQDMGEERGFYQTVAVHEMAHQWWGHLVGWNTYHDQWLSEGLAEFSCAMYLKQFQPGSLNEFWGMKRQWLLSNNRFGYRPVDAGPLWMNTQLDTYRGGSSRIIYEKGAYVIEMLRVMMYDPSTKNPDARFITMMKDFMKTYAGKNASTGDFRKTVEKHIGEPMDWFFDQWVYGTRIPSYDFSYQISDAGDGKTKLDMTLTQSNVGESFRVHLPLYAQVEGGLAYLGTIKTVGTGPVKTTVQLPMRPNSVLLDPGRSILAHINQ